MATSSRRVIPTLPAAFLRRREGWTPIRRASFVVPTRLQMVRDIPLPFPPEPAAYAAVQATRAALDDADHNEGRRNGFLRALDAAGLGFDS